MRYISTRDSRLSVTAAEAIVAGLAPDGGLFLPESIPQVSAEELKALCGMTYPERAADVLGRFLTDFTARELAEYAEKAYARAKFPPQAVAPVVKLRDNTYVLELFHGPTCAFKDFALQLLPFLLSASLKKSGEDKTVVILVATSGDTGKAALEGFAGVPGTKIGVFFPDGGTSSIQRLQMTTQSGANVMVAAVRGNFDDAQNGVKRIFTDTAYAKELAAQGCVLSSANSINWGRLVPQVAYYFSAYCDLVNQGAIRLGDKVNVTVPTGNFGNILAAYYAKHAGLPVAKLICASNRNSVLTDFITTGTYDRNRPFYLTSSPSMDILVSSNLERLLYLLCGCDDGKLRGFMEALKTDGRYTVDAALLAALRAGFDCGCCDDEQTAQTIRETWERTGYLCDPHTAVGVRVYEEYRARTGDAAPALIASTASPFKFCASVLTALGKEPPADDFAMLAEVAALTGREAPAQLTELRTRPERFTEVVEPAAMRGVVDRLAAL